MQVSYFVLDAAEQLVRIAPAEAEQLWLGQKSADQLTCDVGDELRLVTVLATDTALQPVGCFYLRLELSGGIVTRESKIRVLQAMSQTRGRRNDHPHAQQQLSGWPPDIRQQLAVAVDTPIEQMRHVGVGGPLVMSELWGIPLARVLDYFDQAVADDANGESAADFDPPDEDDA